MLKNNVNITKIFTQNARAGERTVVNVGGARSGKSHALAQLLITRAVNLQGAQIAISRKTMPALKMTAMRLVVDLLKKYEIYKPADHNKMEHYYSIGKSRIQFFSLDNPEKIKSTEFNYIWLEEATEFTYNDYVTLLTRLSAPVFKNARNQIFLTLNPNSAHSWIHTKLLSQSGVSLIKSSYKDNPYLSAEYIDTLKNLKNIDENAYRVFTLGEWGQNKGLVYDKYTFVDALPPCGEVIYGLDFGFNNPTALVKVKIHDGALHARELLYESGLTNNALIDKLKTLIPPHARGRVIYADAAEPDRIKEIFNAGFNILPALKNVAQGIISIKQRTLFITKNSLNLIKEIQTYAWKEDLNGAPLEEPVKYNDHALDALRYAAHTYFTRAASVPEISFI